MTPGNNYNSRDRNYCSDTNGQVRPKDYQTSGKNHRLRSRSSTKSLATKNCRRCYETFQLALKDYLSKASNRSPPVVYGCASTIGGINIPKPEKPKLILENIGIPMPTTITAWRIRTSTSSFPFSASLTWKKRAFSASWRR